VNRDHLLGGNASLLVIALQRAPPELHAHRVSDVVGSASGGHDQSNGLVLARRVLLVRHGGGCGGRGGHAGRVLRDDMRYGGVGSVALSLLAQLFVVDAHALEAFILQQSE
jgi:hypothetical protein